MNRPLNTVTVSLPAVAVQALERRVADGEFASLDQAMVAELLELEHRRAVEFVGGEAAFAEIAAEFDQDDPASEVDAFEYLEKLRGEFAEMARSKA